MNMYLTVHLLFDLISFLTNQINSFYEFIIVSFHLRLKCFRFFGRRFCTNLGIKVSSSSNFVSLFLIFFIFSPFFERAFPFPSEIFKQSKQKRTENKHNKQKNNQWTKNSNTKSKQNIKNNTHCFFCSCSLILLCFVCCFAVLCVRAFF